MKKKYNFSDKNDHLFAWRDFKKIFIVYALMVNGTLSQKFHPNSTLTG